MTANQIKTPEASMYNTNDPTNTKIHFRNSILFKNPYFAKSRHSTNYAFYAEFYGTIIICLIIMTFSFGGDRRKRL